VGSLFVLFNLGYSANDLVGRVWRSSVAQSFEIHFWHVERVQTGEARFSNLKSTTNRWTVGALFLSSGLKILHVHWDKF
jgi:hypothetical protein